MTTTRVLIVDDDAVDRKAVRRALSTLEDPVLVDEASALGEAREALRGAAYDCVLLDFFLPDGDGLRLVRELRERGDRTPIVILTGQGDETIAVELMKAGASDYLPKAPSSPERIAQCVRTALRIHAAERQAALAEAERARALAKEQAARAAAEAAERRLRHQLDFTTAVTNSLAEGVVAVDLDGRPTFANPAAEAMLGATADQLRGAILHDLLHPGEPEAQRAACPLARGLGGRAVVRGESTFVGANRRFPAAFAIAPIASGERAVGAVVAFDDVSERNHAAAELEASRRQVEMSERLSALGTLVSGVAHEIRTPLTYIQNNVYLIRHRLKIAASERPDLHELFGDVLRFGDAALDGVARIDALVKDLRPFSNAPRGITVLAGLDGVVAGAVDFFRATHRGRVEVRLELAPTPLVRVDREQFQRAVLNLLINAVEAMPRGGSIRVATRAEGDHAAVDVADTGPGLPPDVQSRMFDPFFTTKAEGTGLGLAITRRIVETHGGTIGFRTAAGQGTTFTILLPTATGPGGTDAKGAREDGNGGETAGAEPLVRLAERAAPDARSPEA